MINDHFHKNRPAPSHTQEALADYLQDLLLPQEEAPRRGQPLQWAEPPGLDPRIFTVAPPQARPEGVAPAPIAEPKPGPEPEVKPQAVADSAPPVNRTESVTTPVKPVAIATRKVPVEEVAEAKPVAGPEVRQNRWIEGRPEWAQAPFDCLLFSVGGLKLAVPLVLLGAVHPLEGELTPLFGRPRWFMGLLKRSDRNVRVVDTAQWVMPDRYRSDARSSYGFVIRLDNSEWGLACDEVAQSFRLKPDQVKWRSEDSRRPWLAGTVKSQMCALLDVGQFARMLEQAEKTQKLDLDA